MYGSDSLDNLNEETRSVLQDSRVWLEALRGGAAWQPNRGCT